MMTAETHRVEILDLADPIIAADALRLRKLLDIERGGDYETIRSEDKDASRTVNFGRYVGETLVGVVCLEFNPSDPKVAELTKLSVDPAHWRNGHARALVTGLMQTADEHGVKLLWADARVASSTTPGVNAKAVFENLGFVPKGKVGPNQYDIESQYVVKRFDNGR